MYTFIVIVLSVLVLLFIAFATIVGLWECLDASHTPEWLDTAYDTIRDIFHC